MSAVGATTSSEIDAFGTGSAHGATQECSRRNGGDSADVVAPLYALPDACGTIQMSMHASAQT